MRLHVSLSSSIADQPWPPLLAVMAMVAVAMVAMMSVAVVVIIVIVVMVAIVAMATVDVGQFLLVDLDEIALGGLLVVFVAGEETHGGCPFCSEEHCLSIF